VFSGETAGGRQDFLLFFFKDLKPAWHGDQTVHFSLSIACGYAHAQVSGLQVATIRPDTWARLALFYD
jgi:hypothetical protein